MTNYTEEQWKQIREFSAIYDEDLERLKPLTASEKFFTGLVAVGLSIFAVFVTLY